jgi:hypothetical protein
MADTPRFSTDIHLRSAGVTVSVNYYEDEEADLATIRFGSWPHSEVALFLSRKQFEALRKAINDPKVY